MFKNTKAFSSFSVNDLKSAKQFYAETLGLDVSETPEGLRINAGGNSVFAYPKPNHVAATFTILNFLVEDIERAVDELTARGVRLEHYDEPGPRTDEKGIHRTPEVHPVAWFRDLAGNLLSIIQE